MIGSSVGASFRNVKFLMLLRLVEHRMHGVRIMHEFLLGQEIIRSEQLRAKTSE